LGLLWLCAVRVPIRHSLDFLSRTWTALSLSVFVLFFYTLVVPGQVRDRWGLHEFVTEHLLHRLRPNV
jgi:hypothetical protein